VGGMVGCGCGRGCGGRGGGGGGEQNAGAPMACVWDWNVLKGYVESARRDYAFNESKDLAKPLCGN